MVPNKLELEALLTKHGQLHLLQFWDRLSDEEKQTFSNDLLQIDFDKMKCLYDTAAKELQSCQIKKDTLMEHLPKEIVVKKGDASQQEEQQQWWDVGLKSISEGEVAVLLLAGGQGTRLGVSYPKGMYNVGLPSNKTLYQLQAERILKLQQLAQEKYRKTATIKWYIMTSNATLTATQEYFNENSFFGLKSSSVVFFEQHLLPCLTFEGKLMLSSYGSIARSPDGNGGLYKAVKSANILQDMESTGIKNIFVYCVDNILVKVADPLFLGSCIQHGVTCANKVIEKVDPFESVGVVCKVQGKYQVVEYSEISPETAEKRNDDGSLTYKDSNICIHYFNIDYLKKIVSDHLDELPHHIAKKKIPYVDVNGELIKPTAPNGMKLEKFVFDVFQFCENFGVFEAERFDEFSPLKNGPDNPKCSPVSCKQDIFSLHYQYLKEAGAIFTENEANSAPVCEISPLLSYAGEGLAEFHGKTFDLSKPICLQESRASPILKKSKNT